MIKEKVSILMATFNGSNYIECQLRSILKQTYSNFELIICDDSSNDDTVNILHKFLRYDNRIRILENDTNLGFKKNFEKLLSFANCELIAFSDQDDIWDEFHLEKLVLNIGSHDLVCGNSKFIDASGHLLRRNVRSDNCKSVTSDKTLLLTHLCHSNFIQGSALMVRKSLVEQVLPIPNEVEYHDYWFGINAALRGGVEYIPDIILYYRTHGDNVTNLTKESLYDRVFNSKNDFSSNIRFISAVINFNNNKGLDGLEVLRKAISYFNDVSSRTNWKITVRYFLENYKWMYLTNSKKFLRFLKIFVIKY